MTNKENNSSLQQKLLQELEALRSKIADFLENENSSVQVYWDGIAVFRTYPGLTIDEWYNLAKNYSLKEWTALPMQGDLAPTLNELLHKLDNLYQLAEEDSLTGLANRRSLERKLELEVERTRRSKLSLSLAMLDIDNFKEINDSYGHNCGDKALVSISNALGSQIRKNDFASRYGGEEFILLLPGTGLLQAQNMLSRIKKSISGRAIWCPEAEKSIYLTCSIGLITYKGKKEISTSQLIQFADQAMYQAKMQGKNRIVRLPLVDQPKIGKETQVQQQEKHFLFHGK